MSFHYFRGLGTGQAELLWLMFHISPNLSILSMKDILKIKHIKDSEA